MRINIDVYVYSYFLTKTLRALHRGLAIIQICYGPSVIDKTILKKKKTLLRIYASLAQTSKQLAYCHHRVNCTKWRE